MKESVKPFDLAAAFKALDEVEIPEVKGIRANRTNVKESVKRVDRLSLLIEDYYDLNDKDDLAQAQSEREDEIAKAKLARIEKIVDLDAESPEDLLPSYVGKYIIQCPQCMTLFYKNHEDIEESDDDETVVNVNEACQHCGNISGYTLIGKVGEVTPEEADKFEEIPESEEELSDEEPTEEDSTDEEELDLDDIDLDELDLDEETDDEEEKVEESLKESVQITVETQEDDSNEVVIRTSEETEIEELPTEEAPEVEEEAKEEEVEVEEALATMPADAGTKAEIQKVLDTCEKEGKSDEETSEAILEGKDRSYIFYVKYTDGETITQQKSGLLPREIHEICNDMAEDEDVEAVYVSEIINGKEIPQDKYTVSKTEISIDESVNNSKAAVSENEAENNSEAAVSLCESNEEEAEPIEAKKYEDENKTEVFTELPDYDVEVEQKGDKIEIELEPKNAEVQTETQEVAAEVEPVMAEQENEIMPQANVDAVVILDGVEESMKLTDNGSENETENHTENKALNESDNLDADLDKLFDSKEFKTPISETEVDAMLGEACKGAECKDLALTDLENLEDIDESCLEACVSESLTNVYENVESFNVTSCSLNANNFIVEGVIKFKSGATKNTTYTFTESRVTDDTVVMTGLNEDLAADGKFELTSALNEAKTMLTPSSLSYKYTIKSNLVEGLAKISK